MQRIGSWSFIIGVVIAVAAGFIAMNPLLTTILIILGLAVGLLNITTSEVSPFLLAVVALVIMAGLGANVLGEIAVVGPTLNRVFSALMVFLVPAGIIVALKSIYNVARAK